MKTSQTTPRDQRQREGDFARRMLVVLAACACHASVQGEASLNTGADGKEQVRDFDRPLEASATKAEPAANDAKVEEYALLGARHDLNYSGAKTASCQCLAVNLSERVDDASFQWELGAPHLHAPCANRFQVGATGDEPHVLP